MLYVEILVYFPRNRLCCNNHLSINIFKPILFYIEKEDKKSIKSVILLDLFIWNGSSKYFKNYLYPYLD